MFVSEIANVANNLDSLNSVLDTIEERADQIRAQLLELLSSNREIRQSLREENEKNQGPESETNVGDSQETVEKSNGDSNQAEWQGYGRETKCRAITYINPLVFEGKSEQFSEIHVLLVRLFRI